MHIRSAPLVFLAAVSLLTPRAMAADPKPPAEIAGKSEFLRAVPKHLIQACPYRKLCPAVLMVADVGFEDTARHLLYNVDDKRSRISHAACSTIS